MCVVCMYHNAGGDRAGKRRKASWLGTGRGKSVQGGATRALHYHSTRRKLGAYLPLKTGFLFSRKASKASLRSSVFTTRSYMAFSTSSRAQVTAWSPARIAIGPPSQISPANLTASARASLRALVAIPCPSFWASSPGATASRSSSGRTSTSRSARPKKYASGAETRRPVSIRSRARANPINAGRRWVPPAPGIMPSRVSGRPTVAVEARTRKWVERASSSPPPRAREEMAEMVGIGSEDKELKVVRRLARKAAVLSVVVLVSHADVCKDQAKGKLTLQG